MRTKRLLMLATIILGCFGMLSVKAAADSPKEAVKETVEAVLNILRDRELSLPDRKQERRSRISALIRDRFDFREMAMRILARHWKDRTGQEREEFVYLFSDLLISSYISKIESYTNERITYDKDEIKGKGKYGIVSTTVVKKDVDIPIDYKVILVNDKWWVYDVVIEGVSFVSTYRTQYNDIIVGESYTALLSKMRDKLADVSSK